MSSPVTKRDMLWGYSASVLNIGAGLILLPIILRYLPPDDVGLWFVFITLASFAQLLEMGFQPTLARNAAYVYAGAQTLNKIGLPSDNANTGELNKQLLDTLVAASRQIYQIVAAAAALVLLLGGTYYISTLLTHSQDRLNSLVAWIAFAAGYVINFYYGYVNGILQGRGDISQANKVIVITRSLLIFLGSGALVFGYGMIGLGLASLLASIAGRFAAHHFFYKKYKPNSEKIHKNYSEAKIMIKILWHNASRLGVVQLGAFLILRGNILVASSFLGLAVAASYSMTVTLLITLSSMAMVICQIQVPYLSALQTKGNLRAIASVYGEMVFISWAVFLIGFGVLLGIGDYLLLLIGSETKLIPMPLLILLGIVFFLEMNHSVAATYLTTINRIPFVAAALLSGAAILLLGVSTVSNLGLLSLIIAQGFVQIAYNNWKWPLEANKNMQTNFIEISRLGSQSVIKRFFSK